VGLAQIPEPSRTAQSAAPSRSRATPGACGLAAGRAGSGSERFAVPPWSMRRARFPLRRPPASAGGKRRGLRAGQALAGDDPPHRAGQQPGGPAAAGQLQERGDMGVRELDLRWG